MVSGNFHAIFDPQTYREFVEIVGKGNVRRVFEDFMLNTIATDRKDAEGINIQILNIEIDKLQKRLNKVQAELQNKLSMKEKYEQMQVDAEEQRLKKEKDDLEKKSRCANCGNMQSKKFHIFPVGNVCNSCFLNADKHQIKKWNQK